ncbi:PH domain-containing protein [Oleiharenicola sp. Vm1]|uniref:PH domain-containing protein n=1 Tax=Oleiharenicola sp. Vm1 TaxID=3398393 RepID=UPI0039F52DAD
MYTRLTAALLHWLRVPPEPQPPHGDPRSLRVFRAGRNFFFLRLARWGVTQLAALAGIVFWVAVFVDVEAEVQARHEQAAAQRVNPKDARNAEDYLEKIGALEKTPAPAAAVQPAVGPETPAAAKAKPKKPRVRVNGWAGFKAMLVQTALWLPPWAFPVLWALKIAGILAYLAQLPVTYLIARLDFEMRWYMVTDRSLRIRHGVWKVNESTMSFANIQQVVVSQGPVQRLLGLADVRVQSAGGGGGEREHRHGSEDDMHHGLFHSVTNADEIRDLILERLRRFRESGLGDPDEKPAAAAPVASPAPAGADGVLAAAHELAAEARALRAALR